MLTRELGLTRGGDGTVDCGAMQWLLLLGGTISLIVSSGSLLVLPQYAGDIIDAVSRNGGTHVVPRPMSSDG